jgi:tetratricopeptide (TPR) repeat protein
MKNYTLVFKPEIPPDIEHAPLIREEAIDWLETNYPRTSSFFTGDVLRMAGESGRRWLITRLRARDIGNEAEFNLPDTADALTVLFLRSMGVKFRDAVDAVVGSKEAPQLSEPRYGGVWNRLIISALDGVKRRVPARLLASAVFALLHNPEDHNNCLVIVKRLSKQIQAKVSDITSQVTHDYVYSVILERPTPSCSVLAPTRELMFVARDQLPARSEITSRHFTSIRVDAELENYELLIGTMRPTMILIDTKRLQYTGRILDLVYGHFEAFVKAQSSAKLETPIEPEQTSAKDLQLWLITQFLTSVYPGSLCEISEMSSSTQMTKVLASSVAKPWEPSPWESAKSLEMLSGYTSRTGIPMVIDKVEYPWITVIDGVESELRYLRSKATNNEVIEAFSALALPINFGLSASVGTLYILTPRITRTHMETEVRILTVFGRIIGETIERHRAAVFSADMSSDIVTLEVLNQEKFKTALLGLLQKKALELPEDEPPGRDVRLPFLLVSAHSPELDQRDPAVISRLKDWLVDTLKYVEWRSFVCSHWPGAREKPDTEGFIGEVPGIGIMVALGNLVSKDELDEIRSAFPTKINQTIPSNSPVRFVAWVLDVPAQRIADADKSQKIAELASEIENWAFNVATLVDDLAQSSVLAREQGEWDAALRRIRQALQKHDARNNSYLRRLAVDCSMALGDWPSALKYAQEAVALSGRELGSGFIRSLCMEADAYFCLCDPIHSWDLYTEAVSKAPNHPLPRYYRGKALLLLARLLRVYEDECRRNDKFDIHQAEELDTVISILVNGAMEDLTTAADLLEKWGLIPESYQYRNFLLLPTLIGQGLGYQLTRSPGPAASRLQSARRSFPKDDIFFREFLFAKCWEQGTHRTYAALLLGDRWKELQERLLKTFGSQAR